ncbi:MAG TPA: hypothetical protein VD864_11585 [Nocardioides sp.]|nr:hypothetical protein [Nocardioides sp.]
MLLLQIPEPVPQGASERRECLIRWTYPNGRTHDDGPFPWPENGTRVVPIMTSADVKVTHLQRRVLCFASPWFDPEQGPMPDASEYLARYPLNKGALTRCYTALADAIDHAKERGDVARAEEYGQTLQVVRIALAALGE